VKAEPEKNSPPGTKALEQEPAEKAGLETGTPSPQVAPAPAETSQEHKGHFTLPPLKEEVLSHLHNKTVHFPIAFAIGALVLLLLSFRRPDLASGAHVLIIMAALTAIAALFFGLEQGKVFERTAKEWVLEAHERLGYGTLGTLLVWSAMIFIPQLKKHAWLWGFVVAGLVTVTAFYGGILAHVE
jgi:uncharacterized membrane protein